VSDPYSFQGEAYGTTWQIKFFDDQDLLDKDELERKVKEELTRIDSIFSLYDEDSTISKINKNKILSWNNLPGYEDFKELSKISNEVVNDSSGSYEVFLNGKWDFNSIAKGYAVDRLCDILESYNIKNYMVEIGGEIRFSGKKPDAFWKFAIIDPSLENKLFDEFSTSIPLSIATSGNYRNPGHIVDPVLNISVNSNLLSVSVIDETSTAKADAWATALFANEKDWFYLARDKKIAAFFIFEEEGKINSSASEKWIELLK
tara:strand:- start:5527 stop:6306 length:780 start_codon:yes stop_codon:yes gene_type:complete